MPTIREFWHVLSCILLSFVYQTELNENEKKSKHAGMLI